MNAPAPGQLDELLGQWLRLQERCNRSDDDDDEVVRLAHEMDAVQRAIFAGNPTTESDWRALVAALCIGVVEGISYRNQEAVEALYQRFVIDRFTDPKTRRRQQHGSRKRVERAKERVAELEEAQP
jgi:hypothetical protein